MKNITLRQLRYFEALVIHGHFGRAAEAVSVSQPALSVQIKELESELGGQLFERGPRYVRLTRFGETTAKHVRQILREVEALNLLARTADGGLTGHLRVGIIPTVAPYLLPKLVEHVTRKFEGIEIQLRESQTESLISELADGRLDTAILALPISEPDLEEMPLFEERFLLIRPAADAKAPIPNAEALRTMRLLLLEEGHCFRDQALSFCGLRKSAPRESLEGSSLSTLVQMVGVGMGVTLIPEMAVPVEAASAPVIVSPLPDPQPSRTIGMVWRQGSPLAPGLTRMAEEVRAVGLKLLADGPSRGLSGETRKVWRQDRAI